MKLFIMSDIHGSIYYLDKAIECYNEEKADYILILGDILYHGLEIHFQKIMILKGWLKL